MKRVWLPFLGASAAVGISLALSAPAQFYHREDLLSDGAVPAPNVNPNLVNPWGLAASDTSPFWISNQGTGTSSVVDGEGVAVLPDVAVPADRSGNPTGIVFAGGDGFEVSGGGVTGPSIFLFVTLEGRIIGWNPDVSLADAMVAVDLRGTGATYTGAALAESNGERFLYVANFGEGRVDVFDSAFASVDSFTDENVPANFEPFGITTIDGQLYVTFAERDPATGLSVAGPSKGFITVFDADGSIDQRLISRGELNAPWGLVVAPGGFGRFSHKLLVGNFGDGRILAYNIHNGRFRGALEDESGEPIVIPGIWGLLFGNGVAGGDPKDLYFTAGIEHETHGVFGEIEVEH